MLRSSRETIWLSLWLVLTPGRQAASDHKTNSHPHPHYHHRHSRDAEGPAAGSPPPSSGGQELGYRVKSGWVSSSFAGGRFFGVCSRHRSMRSRRGGERLSGMGGGFWDDAICNSRTSTMMSVFARAQNKSFCFPVDNDGKANRVNFFTLPVQWQVSKSTRVE